MGNDELKSISNLHAEEPNRVVDSQSTVNALNSAYRIPYFTILWTFARNSLVRDLSFRTNFILEAISSLAWTLMNLAFFKIIFLNASSIGRGTGWGEYEFYIFLGTVWIINSIVQTVFMPNAQEFSELIRTGHLDFALLKPINTQFLISFPKFNWSSLVNAFAGIVLVNYSLIRLSSLAERPLELSIWSVPIYILFLCCGIGILYSIILSMASLSVWFGRNQNIYLVYFYLTQFYRYPSEIYQRGVWGYGLWAVFSFAIPILLVANVPARFLARPLRPEWTSSEFYMIGFTLIATVASLFASRWVFNRSLLSYRSASS
ncbi:MAG TPA: ABC-2 family transporter protein [Pirellulaceae bacterium]|nr:ABC-2 family transporter protein [Pirellulaceae bacterium]HMO91872.1 ABC-2 family transporter protein [Pirellulaceae bacterium]HMP69718.1 ABC-2 family transporter protein [Pirellulaceae bacterium]